MASKLEILYRKLGDEVLSPATLQGLHTILQHIWQYDYPSCLQVPTYSTPSSSTTGSTTIPPAYRYQPASGQFSPDFVYR